MLNRLIRPHLGSSRKIHPGQRIHSSLLLGDEASASYNPKARPVNDDSSFWTILRTKGFQSEWLEIDLYKATQTAMEDYIAGNCNTALHVLNKIATSGKPTWFQSVHTVYLRLGVGDGRQAIYEKMIEVLRENVSESKVQHQLLDFSMGIFERNPLDRAQRKLMRSVEIRSSLSKLSESQNKEYQETVHRFLVFYSNRG